MKLDNGSYDEKNVIVSIMWSLAANNQKTKIIFKSLQLDVKLQQLMKHNQLLSDESINDTDMQRLTYVLNMIRDNEKSSQR